MDLHKLLGLHPSSPELVSFLDGLSKSRKAEVKAYSDAVYYNYHSLGLSLLFSPISGYKPKTGTSENDIQREKLSLSGIDIYNVIPTDGQEKDSRKIINATYEPFPSFPFTIPIISPPPPTSQNATTTPSPSLSPSDHRSLEISPDSTGKDFVIALGEPERKGGGSGPSSGSIGIWTEWTKEGLMVEFGGNDARGPQAWERGKDARWSVLTIFERPNAS